MTKKDQRDYGFAELVGETIVSIDITSINVVHFHCASGKVVSVDAESSHHGIPVIQANFDWPQSKKI